MTIANTSGKTLFNVHSAVNYYNPLASFANGINFVFAGKQSPWPNDQIPPTPNTSIQYTEYGVFDDMIFGKIITPDDVILMVNNYTWTNNTIYAMYNDLDPDLFNKQFYVASPQNGNYYVFKCINNNGNTASISQPLYTALSPLNDYYETSDGYIWKYMYTITGTNWSKFATSNFMPVIPDPITQKNAVNGAIETILLNVSGNNYISFANGQFQDFVLDGNPLLYAIDNSVAIQLNIVGVTGSFTVGETVQQVGGNTGVVALANSTFLQLIHVNGQFTISGITGLTSGATATPATITSVGTSSNSDFYNGCSLYIQSGTGFGQIRTIENYSINGTQRIIEIDSAFTTIPDFTSHYLICPKVEITGDGTGAEAISYVNTSTFSISSVQMVNVGQNYSWCNVSINGNTGLFGVGSQFFGLVTEDSVGSFTVGETVAQGLANQIATGIVQFANNTVVKIEDITGSFTTSYSEFGIANINGAFTANETISQSNSVYGTLSFVNSSYIAIRNIVNGSFSLIKGNITGNTSGATANLAYPSTLVGTSSNARATILSVSSSAAQVQGIISPIGGHGSNPYTELNANKVGVSVTFNNTEGNTIPASGVYGNTTQYRTIGILSQPYLANVQLVLGTSGGTFQLGETVVQRLAANVIDSVAISNNVSYHYTIGNYKTLTLNVASSFVVNDSISQVTPGANGIIVNTSGNTVIVRTDSGVFTNSVVVVKTSNTLVNANVIGITSGFTNSVFSLDSSNNLFTTNTVTNYIKVKVNNLPFPDFTYLLATTNAQSFVANSTSISFKNYTLTNNDIVAITMYTQQSIVSNNQYVASGFVNFANSTVVYLSNVNGSFVTGANVYGLTTEFTSSVNTVTTSLPIFNATTRITGIYQGANTFNIDDFVQQIDPLSQDVTGYGTVQGIQQGANSSIFIVSLTNVKGNFEISDIITSSYKYITTNTATFEVTGVTLPDLVTYSGNVMYIENIIPITRSNTQNETNKLVLTFF